MNANDGKTKTIIPLWPGSEIGQIVSKDAITAGDGAKRDVIPGKAELATRTTCNVFEYLRNKGIPTAYIGRDNPTTFLAEICDMIPVEVVVRCIATGSYLKRHPGVAEGTVFDDPVIEFFYKTTNRRLGDRELPCDDPLMLWDIVSNKLGLYRPDQPITEGAIDHIQFSDTETEILHQQLDECAVIANKVNTHLCKVWGKLGGTLYDFKLEFGVASDNRILLADVVDSDSWRVMWKGTKLSKQGYRDGDDLDRTLGIYRLAASLSDRMPHLP